MKNIIVCGKYTLLLAFIFSLTFTSCKKDNEKENEPTKKELLSNKWKVSDVKNADGTSVIALPFPQIICLKDNIFTLKSDDSYSIDEGATVCDPSTAGTGTWSLTDNETKIKFTPTTGEPLIFDFIEVTAANLKIAYTITNSGIPTADGKYTIILVKA